MYAAIDHFYSLVMWPSGAERLDISAYLWILDKMMELYIGTARSVFDLYTHIGVSTKICELRRTFI